MSKKVIPFPNKGNHSRRREAKHVLFSLSLMTVLVAAVLMNEKIGSSQRSVYIVSENSSGRINDVNRAIASGQPMDPFRDIEYEHELAKRLGQEPPIEERSPAAVSQSITSIDQFRYGLLAGKYRVINEIKGDEPKVSEISFVESSSTEDHPLFLDAQIILNDYKKFLSVTFDSFQAQPPKKELHRFLLLNKDGAVVGEADFRLDESGRLLQMKLISHSR